MSIDISVSIQPPEVNTVSAYNKWLTDKLDSEAKIENLECVAKKLQSFFAEIKEIVPVLSIDPNIIDVGVEDTPFGGQFFFFPDVLSISLKGSSSISGAEFDNKMTKLETLVQKHALVLECDGQISCSSLVDDSLETEKKVQDRENGVIKRHIAAMPVVAGDISNYFKERHPEIVPLVIQLVRKDAVYLDLRIRICCPDKHFKNAYSFFHGAIEELKKIARKHTKEKFDFQIDRAGVNSGRIHVLWTSEKGNFLKDLTSFFKD